MDKSQKLLKRFEDDHYFITLMNGRELVCHPKSVQPKSIVSNDISLDTTGEYLSTGKPFSKLQTDNERRAADRFYHRMFVENAWFIYENAERIYSDSRMFFTPVHINNNLAYIGTSGFRNMTVGVYLEWWKSVSEHSIDKAGNLIYYVAGSPLSGSNACNSVNRENKSVEMARGTSFKNVWRSLIEVNSRYNEAAQRCEAYTFEEFLIKLRGEAYRPNLESALVGDCQKWE